MPVTTPNHIPHDFEKSRQERLERFNSKFRNRGGFVLAMDSLVGSVE